jgi:Lipopolysaccharide-assembly
MSANRAAGRGAFWARLSGRASSIRGDAPQCLLGSIGLFLAAAVCCTGCGYHVQTSERAATLPKNVITIAVPAFKNATNRYRLAKLLPEDISREFIERTTYRVVSDPSKADAVLEGAVMNFVYFPLTSDAATTRITSVMVIVTLRLTLTQKSDRAVLFSRPSAEFRERYEISENPQQYFDESGPAMIRLSKAVASSVVSAVLSNF